jgi:hypothetical protein
MLLFAKRPARWNNGPVLCQCRVVNVSPGVSSSWRGRGADAGSRSRAAKAAACAAVSSSAPPRVTSNGCPSGGCAPPPPPPVTSAPAPARHVRPWTSQPAQRSAPVTPGGGGSPVTLADPGLMVDRVQRGPPHPHSARTGGRSVQTGGGPSTSSSPASSRVPNDRIYHGVFGLAGGFGVRGCTKNSLKPKCSRTLTPQSARAPRRTQGPAPSGGVTSQDHHDRHPARACLTAPAASRQPPAARNCLRSQPR